jgi:hypothetical protein
MIYKYEHQRAFFQSSFLFLSNPEGDPIAGMAHHLVAPCPASDSHHVGGT